MALLEKEKWEGDAIGIEYSITDVTSPLPPRQTVLLDDESLAWLTKKYDEDYAMQIITKYGTPDITEAGIEGQQSSVPFPSSILDEILGSSIKQYRSIEQVQTGGSFCVAENSPYKFVLQTPSDGGPFCSIALMSLGRALVRGFYYFTDDCFDLRHVMQNYGLFSGWRGSGFHIMVVPVSFLGVHAMWLGKEIRKLNQQLGKIENLLSTPGVVENVTFDFAVMTRELYECSKNLNHIERRAVFNKGLANTIEQFLSCAAKQRVTASNMITEPLQAHKNMMEAQEHDIKAIPRRIKSQQTMIFNLIIQRDMRLNLEIAETSHDVAQASANIAEATMNDSASMKTIAILTMLFLPGTAVASFFSMTMFNWSADAGQPLATSFIWIYFAATVPLTLLTLAIWYFCLRRRQRGLRTLRSTTSFPPDDFKYATNGSSQATYTASNDYLKFGHGNGKDFGETKHGHQA